MTRLQGCGTALVTPFTESGAIDFPALRALVDWQIAEGIDFLVPCGSTGEAQTLDDARAGTGRGSRGRDRRGPGAGDGGRHQQRHRARGGRDPPNVRGSEPTASSPPRPTTTSPPRAGSSAISWPSPTPPPSRSASTTCPGRTAVNLQPDVALRLAEHPNVMGIKEASGDLEQVMRDPARAGPDDSAVLSGDDWLTLPIIAAGGDGLVSVASNEVPGAMTRAGAPDARRETREGARLALSPAALDGRQLPGDQPRPGQSRART